MERWYNTLRQHTGCFVRKTLSFSKKDWWHDRDPLVHHRVQPLMLRVARIGV